MEHVDSAAAETGGATDRRVIGESGSLFLARVEGETGVDIGACYQCERCTNACPVAGYMDIKPHQVIRYTQLGWRQELMHSVTIWVCLSCEMCTTYCPNEVDVAELINHLRNMAAQSAIEPREKDLAEFHHVFLHELQRFGRVNEFWLMAAFNSRPSVLKAKLRDGSLGDDLRLGYSLWRRGRLKLLPHRSRAIQDIRRLYRRRRIT
jgi:heterodisulfide reductase subunit C